MTDGEWITRLTALAAVALYGASLLVDHPQGPIASRRSARWLWTAGCAAYLVHVACAFGLVYHWSRAAAYRHTADRTSELIGLDWGGGLYFNHLFTVVWLLDTAAWWLSPLSYQTRPRWLTLVVRGFMAFMVFQATVVFGAWPARAVGVALFLAWGVKLRPKNNLRVLCLCVYLTALGTCLNRHMRNLFFGRP